MYKFPKIFLLLFLLILIIIGAVPGYLTGKWQWEKPPQLTNLEALRHLRKTNITLAGWQTKQQDILNIGGLQWVFLELDREPKTKAVVLLLPQSEPTDQPQVEWTDISGLQRWKTDSEKIIKFDLNSHNKDNQITQNIEVEARFFRAWTQRQTYAVLQWYAFPNGGKPTPSHWFWKDRKAQLSKKRVPWVAVNIQIFIEPLGDISSSREIIESLAKDIQTELIRVMGNG